MKLPQLIAASLLVSILPPAFAMPLNPSPTPNGYVARMSTTLGNIDIWLRSDIAPLTVKNFIAYITGDPLNGSYYQNTFFHRSVRVPNVIQGGGYKWNDVIPHISPVIEGPAVANEHSISLLNVRGNIAMALTSTNGVTDINSATNQWYFNVADNPTLDPQLFTVFGTVINTGMDVVDAIAALPVEDQSAQDSALSTLLPLASKAALVGAFGSLPLVNHLPGSSIAKQNLALVNSITVLSSNAPVQSASGSYTTLGMYSPPFVADTFEAAPNPAPTTTPAGVTFGEGFFKIVMTGLTTGQTVNTILNLPPGAYPNTYYKYGPTPDNPVAHWYNFMWDGKTGAIMGTDPTQVALVFVDGERGDDDLAADGRISDVGGPGVGPAPASSGGGGALDWLSLSSGLLVFIRRAPGHRRQ